MSSRRKRFALVCLLYTETHDGFSQAKGIRRQDRIKVLDMVAFSVAAGYCFEASTLQLFNYIAIGVMAPARQDCGKYIHFNSSTIQRFNYL